MVNEQRDWFSVAEMATIGAVMQHDDPLKAYRKATAFVTAQDFYGPIHKTLWNAIASLANEGISPDERNLKARLIERGQLEQIGGDAYLFQVTGECEATMFVDHYANIMRQASIKRNMERLAKDTLAIADDTMMPMQERMAKVSDKFRRFTETSYTSECVPIDVAIDAMSGKIETVKQPEGSDLSELQFTNPTVPSGSPIDAYITGLHKQSLNIIAARPSIGKTSLAISSARRLLDNGASVAMFTFEMSEEEYLMRFVSQMSGIPTEKFKKQRLTREDHEQAMLHMDDIRRNWALRIYDGAGPDASRLVAMIETEVERGADYIFIDHAGLVRGEGRSKYEAQSAVADACLAAKQLCKIPIIALVQFHRTGGAKTNMKGDIIKQIPPGLSDIRDSGKWEENADLIVAIHRPGQVERECNKNIDDFYRMSPNELDPVQLRIVKNRHGKCGTVECSFHGPTQAIVDTLGNETLRREVGIV